jgi:hypothetical protein
LAIFSSQHHQIGGEKERKKTEPERGKIGVNWLYPKKKNESKAGSSERFKRQ